MTKRSLVSVACILMFCLHVSFLHVQQSHAQLTKIPAKQSRTGEASHATIKNFLDKEFVKFKNNPRIYDATKKTYVKIDSIQSIRTLSEFLKKGKNIPNYDLILAIFNTKAYYASNGRVGALTVRNSLTTGQTYEKPVSTNLYALYGIQTTQTAKSTVGDHAKDQYTIKNLEMKFTTLKKDPKFHQYKKYRTFKDVLISFTQKIAISHEDGLLLDQFGEYAHAYSSGAYGIERRIVRKGHFGPFPFIKFRPNRAEKDLLTLYKIQGTIHCVQCDTYGI